MHVLCRREGSGSRSKRSVSNKNMSASTCDEDMCPKPKDRCAQRDHCGDPPKDNCRKDKKEKRKKFVCIPVTFCYVMDA